MDETRFFLPSEPKKMDEQLKLIKSIIALNIIIIIVVFVILGLQIFRTLAKPNAVSLGDLFTKQQERLDKLESQQEEANVPTDTQSQVQQQAQQQVQQQTQSQVQQQAPAQTQSGTPPQQQQTIPSGGTQKPSGSTNAKCGDGTCDAMEKANPNLCPTDCK